MRIITGKAGRIAIKVPAAVARPSTDFVRQAVFSMLGEQVIDARTLDLFAGSGALGLEALSRGASSCVFVDNHRQACSVIQQNLTKSKLEGGQVVKADAIGFLKRDASRYDLIFADPPYWKHHGDPDLIADLGDLIAPRLNPNGWLLAETSTQHQPPELAGLKLLDRRQYGSSAILLYAPEASP